MVSLIRSGGAIRPTSQVGGAVDTSRLELAKAVTQFAVQQQKVDNSYNAFQSIEVENKLKRFDNDSIIALKDAPNDPKTINSFKQNYLGKRKTYLNSLLKDIKDPKMKQRIIQSADTSEISTSFNIDKTLLSKKKDYSRNSFYSSITDLKTNFENSSTADEFANVTEDLNKLLLVNQQAGVINAKEYDKLIGDFKKLRIERAKEIQRENVFTLATQGGLVLDSTSTDHKSIINENFNEAISKIVEKGGSPDEVQSLAVSTSVNTGIIPDTFKTKLSGGLNSNNAPLQFDSAIAIQELIDERPTLQKQFSSKDKAIVKGILKRFGAGVSEEKAVEYTLAEIKENKSQERLIREGEFNQEFGSSFSSKKTQEQLDDIRDDLEDRSGFFFEAEVPNELTGEYRMLVKDYFLNEGVSLDTAEDMAKEKVLGEWSVTEIGKKRYEKYSPEMFYNSIGGSHNWIKDQMLNEVKKNINEDISSRKLNKQLTLKPILNTLNGRPKYFIYREMEQGIELVLDEENKPIEFQPDITKTVPYKEQTKERDLITHKERVKTRRQQIRRTRELQRGSSIREGVRIR